MTPGTLYALTCGTVAAAVVSALLLATSDAAGLDAALAHGAAVQPVPIHCPPGGTRPAP